MPTVHRSTSTDWPDIPFDAWQDTSDTLHLWTQVVGKIRLTQTPWQNHSWHVPLYVSARGLTTSPIPYGSESFEIEFDFITHELSINCTNGSQSSFPLEPMTVADFYGKVMAKLDELGYPVRIYTTPSEIADAISLEDDTTHASYDADYAHRFWQALNQIDRVFKEFRTSFIGKASPVHFFWGSFDLAVTRFSGRDAPPHPGGVPNFPDWVAREAYSHEVSSAGFWPGANLGYPAFYSYAYPGPDGFADAPVEPSEATWSSELGEFLLPYDAVRTSDSPDETLLAFLQTTYEAAADLGNWDRDALEGEFGPD